MWLRLFPWPTTTGRCWPGVLNLHSSDVSWVLRVWCAQNSGKKYFFKETCATMGSTRGFGFKSRNFADFFQARGPKNLFWVAVAKAAA